MEENKKRIFVNLYRDEQGKYISDFEYSSFELANKSKDEDCGHIATVELIYNNPEPTIPLSEAISFAEWCSDQGWQFASNGNYWIYTRPLGLYHNKTTSELLEIFRSGKENLND